MFKIFLQFPDALRPSFPRLKEKLDDSDPCMPLIFMLTTILTLAPTLPDVCINVRLSMLPASFSATPLCDALSHGPLRPPSSVHSGGSSHSEHHL